jgi:hypothetical protein
MDIAAMWLDARWKLTAGLAMHFMLGSIVFPVI